MGCLPAVSSLPSATSRRSGADLLRTIAAGTAASVGTAFLRSLVRHVAEALDAEIAFAAEVARTGGIDVEDVLDEISRRRRGPQGFRA